MAKKQTKKTPSPKKHTGYKLEGNKVTRIKKACPRCGAGTFMANHKGRRYCGHCHYTEFDNKEAASDKKEA